MQISRSVALLAVLFSGAAQAQTVGGAYTVAGTNPDGSTYGGAAEIAVVYEVQPDGVLAGYWTVVDKDGVGGEILTPKK